MPDRKRRVCTHVEVAHRPSTRSNSLFDVWHRRYVVFLIGRVDKHSVSNFSSSFKHARTLRAHVKGHLVLLRASKVKLCTGNFIVSPVKSTFSPPSSL